MKLAITSPPYSSPGEPREALAAYRTPNPGYGAYLSGLQAIYRQVATLVVPDGWAVIEVSNLRQRGRVTTLAWGTSLVP